MKEAYLQSVDGSWTDLFGGFFLPFAYKINTQDKTACVSSWSDGRICEVSRNGCLTGETVCLVSISNRSGCNNRKAIRIVRL